MISGKTSLVWPRRLSRLALKVESRSLKPAMRVEGGREGWMREIRRECQRERVEGGVDGKGFWRERRWRIWVREVGERWALVGI